MDLILCHQTADFDVLGAAVGLSQLKQGSRIVLTGGAHPAVRDFLALHRDEFALIELRSVNTQQIRSLIVIDRQTRILFNSKFFKNSTNYHSVNNNFYHDVDYY